MNYNKLYNEIIEKRKIEIPSGYTEEHHIVPRSLGGTDDKDNLVLLTAKEHFICHLLLTKMYPKGSNEYYKMCHAFLMMLTKSKNQERYITSRKYEHLKVSFSERMSALQSGKNNSQYGTMWIYNPVTQQCKKVPKDSILENGWFKGKVTNWNNHYSLRKCKICDHIGCLSRNSIFCSLECKNSIKIKPEITTQKFLNDTKIKSKTIINKNSISNNTIIENRNIIKCKFCEKEFLRLKKERCCSNECRFALSFNKKAVMDDENNTFKSQTECASFHKVSEGTVRLRIKSGIYKLI